MPIGYPDSTHPGELERELGDDVAAVLYRPGKGGNLLDLATTCRIAHDAGVPVMIDGAMFVPPVDRLRGFFDAGADLVAVSGVEGFRGPQASGLLCGRPELIDVIALHHQDMDERDTTWPRNLGAKVPATPPRHGIGRPMKVGREQIVGLLTAIERYMRDPGADERAGTAELDAAEAALLADGRIPVHRVQEPTLDVPGLHLDIAATGRGGCGGEGARRTSGAGLRRRVGGVARCAHPQRHGAQARRGGETRRRRHRRGRCKRLKVVVIGSTPCRPTTRSGIKYMSEYLSSHP